ncbi:hypothetical protein EMCRGX_G000985 [Ephydatia muelleri]
MILRERSNLKVRGLADLCWCVVSSSFWHKSRGLALRIVGYGSSTPIHLRTVNTDRISLTGINPLCQSCTTLSTRCGMNTKGVPFISSPPNEIVKENTTISPLSQTDAWRFEPPETPGSYGYVVTYRLRSLSLFQGMASPALVANTSAAPSSIDDEIPALSNKDRLSSSLRMRTSFWSMNRQLWFLGSCMMSLSGLVEMAHFSNPTAFFSFSGQQEYQIGAGLTWEETKGPPSEQQGQFTALDAAIHFWRHLAHTSAPHCSSSGCERMLEHTAHFSSFSINWD